MFRIVSEFIEKARDIDSEVELCDAFQSAIGDLGCNRFSAWSEEALRDGPSGAVSLERFPTRWLAEVLERQTWNIDPLPRLARKTTNPFLWTHPQVCAQLSDAENLFMTEAEAAGVYGGLLVPVRSAYASLGSVSIFSDGGAVHPGVVNKLHNMGVVFYESARRLLASNGTAEFIPRRTLSTVERDCLVWTSLGKDDWDIGAMLGVSEDEVRVHIGRGMRKFGVPTRTQAVVQALMTNQIMP